jgi:hypothetical protein
MKIVIYTGKGHVDRIWNRVYTEAENVREKGYWKWDT